MSERTSLLGYGFRENMTYTCGYQAIFIFVTKGPFMNTQLLRRSIAMPISRVKSTSAAYFAAALPPDEDEIEDEGAEIDDEDDDESLYGEDDAPLEDDYGNGDSDEVDYVDDDDEEEEDEIVEAGDEEEDNLHDDADVEDPEDDEYLADA